MRARRLFLQLFIIVLLLAVWVVAPAAAQEDGRVQTVEGRFRPGELNLYLVQDLQPGETLYLYLTATSGNFDPFLGVLPVGGDFEPKIAAYQNEIAHLVQSSTDLALSIEALNDRTFLAWDDDSGVGYDAALAFSVTSPGDYNILISSTYTALGREASGGYRLTVGIDAPQVLSEGIGQPSEPIITFDRQASALQQSVQEVTGTLAPVNLTHEYPLVDLKPGDTLYAFLESEPGMSAPALILRDAGNKPLAAGNLAQNLDTASLTYTAAEGGSRYVLEAGYTDLAAAGVDYRLLVGLNDPGVLAGTAVPSGEPLIRSAIPVQVGVQLEQIVDIDQQNEFFTAVASLRMVWQDPGLAFSPDTCDCRTKLFTENTFTQFLTEVGDRWPDFTFVNQQGNRWTQDRQVVLSTNGQVTYYERFTTNFQVDFDFRSYPFDNQTFHITVDGLYPDEFFTFVELPEFSGIGPEHGEDEFILTDDQVTITPVASNLGYEVSRFIFSFDAPRHLNYYILQIFIPIILIMFISWVIFFLKDYTRRIEAAAANVLLFIAFGFSLTDNYPRLGYLTFLDALMAVTFVVNAAVVVYNVYLKTLESNGQADRAERIDHVGDFLYPILYLALVAGCVLLFVA